MCWPSGRPPRFRRWPPLPRSAVGLGVLKRVVEHLPPADVTKTISVTAPADVVEAAKASMRATVAAGNPLSVNQLAGRFSLSRGVATQVHRAVLAESNGHPTG